MKLLALARAKLEASKPFSAFAPARSRDAVEVNEALDRRAKEILASKPSFFQCLLSYTRDEEDYKDLRNEIARHHEDVVKRELGLDPLDTPDLLTDECRDELVAEDLAQFRAQDDQTNLLQMAREAVTVRLICVRQLYDAGSRSWKWFVSQPTMLSQLGKTFHKAITAWMLAENNRVREVVAAFRQSLVRLKQQAASRTRDGILAIVASLLLAADLVACFSSRLVELLTRRVLAPGGKSAWFVPLD